MKSLLRLVPWFFVALFGAEIVAVMLPKKDGEFHVRDFGRLPVLLNGRIQPFDSVARNALLQMRSTGDVPLEEVPAWQFWHHPKKLKASQWLLEVLTQPEVADTRPAFLIHHSDLLGELKLQDKGIEKSGLRYYTFNELKPVYDVIMEQGQKAEQVKPEEQTTFQKQAAKLQNAVVLYRRLKVTLQPEAVEDFSKELDEFETNLGPVQAAVAASEKGKEFDQDAVRAVAVPVQQFQLMAEAGYALIVPPLDPEAGRDHWQNMGASLIESFRTGRIHPAVRFLAAMGTAYEQQNPDAFNQALDKYKAWLAPNFAHELLKGRAEFYFNDVKAFLHSMIIYIFALVLAGCALLTFTVVPNLSETLRRSAFYLVILAWCFHTFGLVFRMVLEGRPPVTNLYSSAIFIGWATVFLGLVLERIYRAGIGIVVGSVAGFVTLLIAHNLALGGDTMEMLRAVLDTNFWLATHVVVVTLGYASTFVAGLLAILYIFLGLFTPLLSQKIGPRADAKTAAAKLSGGPQPAGKLSAKPIAASAEIASAAAASAGARVVAPGALDLSKALSKMVYGIVCFATLFSFVGTVLGGIWADQSWGRFWGWDPKENGALLIVLWNALILHARWGGLVRERGLMNLAVFGNVVTSFSWFGVNMLGIGLHSYGFMDAAFKWLMMFITAQLLIIGDGLLPRICWQSFAIGNQRLVLPVRWVALGLNVAVMLVGFFFGYNSVFGIAALLVFFAFVGTLSLATAMGAATTTPPAPAAPAPGRREATA